MPRVIVATPSFTAQTASVNWRASLEPRWCRRTAPVASCTGLTPASMWPSRWRRLWKVERSTRPRSIFTRRMVGRQKRVLHNLHIPAHHLHLSELRKLEGSSYFFHLSWYNAFINYFVLVWSSCGQTAAWWHSFWLWTPWRVHLFLDQSWLFWLNYECWISNSSSAVQ